MDDGLDAAIMGSMLFILILLGAAIINKETADNPWNYPGRYTHKETKAIITKYGVEKHGMFIYYKTVSGHENVTYTGRICKDVKIIGTEISVEQYISKTDKNLIFSILYTMEPPFC